jgi:CheY-like chemotaxis protein
MSKSPGESTNPAPRSEALPIEILLVEDNDGDVRLIRELLKEVKVHNRLNRVADGIEALEFLERRGPHAGSARPDLILLDLNLPRMNGREVLARIKADAGLRRIPVVVLTSSKAEQDIVESYDLHANCFITKPVSLDQFIGVVRSMEDFWLSLVRLPSHGLHE